MQRFIFESASEDDTAALGRALAEALPDGAVVALIGTLGAGKTRLVQAIAEASGVPRDSIASPTFVLVHEYEGRRPVYHFDAYRLADEDEFLALGPEEYFGRRGVVLVEWADRVASCLPSQRLEIVIEPTGETTRRFEIIARGEKYDAVLAAIRQRLQ